MFTRKLIKKIFGIKSGNDKHSSMKKGVMLGTFLAFLLASFMVVYAVLRLFSFQSFTTELSKKTIFEFDLQADVLASEVGPGDTVAINPSIFNNATEAMYVFIELEIPECEEGALYDYEVEENWTLVESGDGFYVYAYGGSELTALEPGETTTELMQEITMKNISNAEYASIDDINVNVTGYGIDATGTSDPASAWEECKALR